MPPLPWYQLDVFSERPGAGNPLGVVIGGTDWSTAAMQRLATWTGLAETTFVMPPQDDSADYRLRIFTPSREIPFAGHPSIGSAHAAIEAGLVDGECDTLIQECGAGRLAIAIEHRDGARRLFVEAPPATVVASGPGVEPRLERLLDGLPPGRLPPARVRGGRDWWLAEAAEESALRAWRPDHRAIAGLAAATGSLGLCLFARCQNQPYDLAVRAFPCGIGIDEDPASGAANALLAAYLAEVEPDGPLARGYSVSQGREIGRDARLCLRIGRDRQVQVGGEVQTVVSGRLHWRQRE